MNQFWVACRRMAPFTVGLVIICLALATNCSAQEGVTDLSVSKSGSPTIFADTDVTYTVTISHSPTSTQDSTPPHTVTDTFNPDQLTFVSVETPDGWTCGSAVPAGPGAATVTCTTAAGSIALENSVIFTFLFHVAPNLENGTSVTNTASIDDPNGSNNTAMFTSTVGTPPPPPVQAGEVLISEFRLAGPNGVSDEYIEFYCNRDADCDISGFSITTFDPSLGSDFLGTFPANSIIPARQFALLVTSFPPMVNPQYSLTSYAFPDFIISAPPVDEFPGRPDFFVDNEGILLRDGETQRIDSVGFAGGGNEENYVEGTGLQRATGPRPADQYAYVRKRDMVTNGRPQDTNNNASDFVLVSVTGAAHPGIAALPVLGAPGPKGLTSPLTYSNSEVVGSLVEPGNSQHAAPNRVRVGSGDSGTLSIRRSFTNNTGLPLDFIRFRVIAITTLNSPNTVGEPQADLRLVTSPTAETFENSQGRTVVIRGSILEWDPNDCGCEPQQPNGGGLNSSVFLDDESTIFNGETVDVQFLLNVVKAGAYRFYIYVEAFPSQEIVDRLSNLQKSTTSRGGRPRGISDAGPRKLIDLKLLPRRIAPRGTKPKTGAFVPTKRLPTITPPPMRTVRPILILRRPDDNPKRKKGKVRIRRKAAAALREKLKPKVEPQQPQQNPQY